MLSRASLLFILKSGCLNSQACHSQLCTVQNQYCDILTPTPYGEVPPSSLLCRTLWKSYLFSWRTKLAKLLCLKCFGRMCLVNFSFCRHACQRMRLPMLNLPLRDAAFWCSLPPALRSCLLRCPNVQHSRLVDFPAFCEFIVSRRRGAFVSEWLTCRACAPGAVVSRWTTGAHCGRTLTKSLELFAAWAAFPSMFAVLARRNGSNSVGLSRMARNPRSWCLGGRTEIVESAGWSLCHVRPSRK